MPTNQKTVSVNNEEILNSCVSMKLDDRIVFVSDHSFVRGELSLLTIHIGIKRDAERKKGVVSLYRHSNGSVEKIEASCHTGEIYSCRI